MDERYQAAARRWKRRTYAVSAVAVANAVTGYVMLGVLVGLRAGTITASPGAALALRWVTLYGWVVVWASIPAALACAFVWQWAEWVAPESTAERFLPPHGSHSGGGRWAL